MQPRSIKLFEIAGLTAAGLGLVRVLIGIIMIASARPAPGAGVWLTQVFLLLLFVGVGLVTLLASRKRHDVGRGAYYVIAAMTILALWQGFGDGVPVRDSSLVALISFLDLLVFGALLGGAIALWQPEAAAHMVPGGIKAPAAPAWGQPGYPPQGGYPPAGVPGASQPVWHDSPTQGVGYPPAGAAPQPGQPGQPVHPQQPGQPPYQPPPGS